MPRFHLFYTVLGASLLLFLVVDIVWTTMHRGGGPLTRMMTTPLWRLAMKTHHRGLGSHRLMSLAGLVLVVITVAVWILLAWGAWTLVFMGTPGAVLSSPDQIPATPMERAYFTGFTVFTLGMGDFVPADHVVWQSFTTIASVSGFVLVTFTLAYLIPVVENVVQKRSFASRITALGASPEALLMTCWNDGSVEALEDTLEAAVEPLSHLRQAHHAYPVLHFFHEPVAAESLALAVARLDEAVRVAQQLEGVCFDHALMTQWDTLLDRFLKTMTKGLREVEAPPTCRWDRLVAEGMPLGDHDAFDEAMAARADRRRRLQALVLGHGWTWNDVCGDVDTREEPRE